MPKPARRPRQGRIGAAPLQAVDLAALARAAAIFTAKSAMHDAWGAEIYAFAKELEPKARAAVDRVLDEIDRHIPLTEEQRVAIVAEQLPKLLGYLGDAARRSMQEAASLREKAATVQREVDRIALRAADRKEV